MRKKKIIYNTLYFNHKVSNMLLEKFEDNQLRIYSKNSDFEYVSELSEHFKKWCEQKGYKNKPLFGTSNDY